MDLEADSVQNETANIIKLTQPVIEKANNFPLRIAKGKNSLSSLNTILIFIVGGSSRPFSYIKNTNDRAQILRRFTPQERPIPVPPVLPIEIQRIPSSETDSDEQSQTPSTNIYETVVPMANLGSRLDTPTPIYETEWTHSLRQLMMETKATNGNPSVSVIELPSNPTDLIRTPTSIMNYFQHHSPHNKFLAERASRTDSIRRMNMLQRLKDDAAFLY